MGRRPLGDTLLLLLRASVVRSIGLIAGQPGVLLGLPSELLALHMIVLAMLLCGSAMRLRCGLMLLGRSGVRLLCHCRIFLLAGDSRRIHKLRQ